MWVFLVGLFCLAKDMFSNYKPWILKVISLSHLVVALAMKVLYKIRRRVIEFQYKPLEHNPNFMFF